MINRFNIFTFKVLDQPIICGGIYPIFSGPCFQELNGLGIYLSDVTEMAPVEILFGADIIGRLYTGRKYQLHCGLVNVNEYQWINLPLTQAC